MSEFQKLEHKKAIEQREKKCMLCCGILAQPRKKILDFYEATLDRNIRASTIVEVLKRWGVASSETAINNHRRGKDGYAKHMESIQKAAGL